MYYIIEYSATVDTSKNSEKASRFFKSLILTETNKPPEKRDKRNS